MTEETKGMIFDLASARQFAQESNAQEWIRLYLHTPPWANVKIWRFMRRQSLNWHGPEVVEISQLQRTCGPEEGMRYREDSNYWEWAVAQIATGLSEPEQVPPLLVCRIQGSLVILDGNHRHEAFRRFGWHTCWALIGSTEVKERSC